MSPETKTVIWLFITLLLVAHNIYEIMQGDRSFWRAVALTLMSASAIHTLMVLVTYRMYGVDS